MSYQRMPYRDKRASALVESEKLRKDIENLEDALLLHARYQADTDNSIRGMIRKEIGQSASRWEHGGEGKLTTYRSRHDLIPQDSERSKTRNNKVKKPQSSASRREVETGPHRPQSRELRNPDRSSADTNTQKKSKNSRESKSTAAKSRTKGRSSKERTEPDLEVTCIKAEWGSVAPVTGGERFSPLRTETAQSQPEDQCDKKGTVAQRHEKLYSRESSGSGSKRSGRPTELDMSVRNPMKAKLLAKAGTHVIDRTTFSSTPTSESLNRSAHAHLEDKQRCERSTYRRDITTKREADYIKMAHLNKTFHSSGRSPGKSKDREEPNIDRYDYKNKRPQHLPVQEAVTSPRSESEEQSRLNGWVAETSLRHSQDRGHGTESEKDTAIRKWAESSQAAPAFDRMANELSQLSERDGMDRNSKTRGKNAEVAKSRTPLSPRQGSDSSRSSRTDEDRWRHNTLASPPIDTMVNRHYRRNSFSGDSKPELSGRLVKENPQRQSAPSGGDRWISHSARSAHRRHKKSDHVANISFKESSSQTSDSPTSPINSNVVAVTTPSSHTDITTSAAYLAQLISAVASSPTDRHSSPRQDRKVPSRTSPSNATPSQIPDASVGAPQHTHTALSHSICSNFGKASVTSQLLSSNPSIVPQSHAACTSSALPATFLTTVPEKPENTSSYSSFPGVPAAQVSADVDPSQLKSSRATCDREVESWLHNLGLQSIDHYVQLFADHQMDLESVRLLTAGGLRDMGIHALGPIMKILKGVQVLNRDVVSVHVTLQGKKENSEESKTPDLGYCLEHSVANACLGESDLSSPMPKYIVSEDINSGKVHSSSGQKKEIGAMNFNVQPGDKDRTSFSETSPQSDTGMSAQVSREKSDVSLKTDQSKGRPAHWRQTSDVADYTNLNDRSPTRDMDVPDFFTVRDKPKDSAQQKSGTDKKVTTKGKAKSNLSKLLSKPPAASRALDDGVSLAAQKFSTKQQQQRLKEEAEEKSAMIRKQMRNEMAARHVRRRSSSLDRNKGKGQRSGLERSASFSSVKDMLQSPHMSARSVGVESVLSTKSLTKHRASPENGKLLPKKTAEKVDAVSQMDDIIASLNDFSPSKVNRGSDGQDMSLDTIRELQKQLNHLEQHIVQQDLDTAVQSDPMTSDCSRSGSREPSTSRSLQSNEGASPRMSVRASRSARERRRQRAAKGWGPEEEGEGMALSASLIDHNTDQLVNTVSGTVKNVPQSTQQRDLRKTFSPTPKASSDKSGEKTLPNPGPMSDLIHVESLMGGDRKQGNNKHGGRISPMTLPTRSGARSAVRSSAAVLSAELDRSKESSPGAVGRKKIEQVDRRQHSVRLFVADLGHICHTGSIKKAELDRTDILFSQTDLLGEGAFSQVFKGTYQGSEVAVKRLRVPLQARDKNYFAAEVSMLQELRHPHVVMLVGVSTSSDNLPLMVLEYMACGNLHTLLHDHARAALSHTEYYQLARDMCAGMLYLHHHKPPVLHLNLKSRNVLIDHGSRAKVADFGFSKLKHEADVKVSKGSKSRMVQRAPAWMAPELLNSGEITAKTDVYSYGIILWEMLTRQTPYEGCSVFQVLENVRLNKRPIVPSDCPSGLSGLIEKCWDKNPAARPGFKVVLRCIEGLSKSRGLDIPSSSSPSQDAVVSIDLSRENGPSPLPKTGDRIQQVTEMSQLHCTSVSSGESENDFEDENDSGTDSCAQSMDEGSSTAQIHRADSSQLPDHSNQAPQNSTDLTKRANLTAVPVDGKTANFPEMSAPLATPEEFYDKNTAQELIDRYLPRAKPQPQISRSCDHHLSKANPEKLLPLRHSLDKPKPVPAHHEGDLPPQISEIHQKERKLPARVKEDVSVPLCKPASSKDSGIRLSTQKPILPSKNHITGSSRKSSSDLLHLKKGVRPPYSDGQPYVPSFHDEIRQARSRVLKSKEPPTSTQAHSDNSWTYSDVSMGPSHLDTQPQPSSSFRAHTQPGLSLTQLSIDHTQVSPDPQSSDQISADQRKDTAVQLPSDPRPVSSQIVLSYTLSQPAPMSLKESAPQRDTGSHIHQANHSLETKDSGEQKPSLPILSQIKSKSVDSAVGDNQKGTMHDTDFDGTEDMYTHTTSEAGDHIGAPAADGQSKNAPELAIDTQYSPTHASPDNPLPPDSDVYLPRESLQEVDLSWTSPEPEVEPVTPAANQNMTDSNTWQHQELSGTKGGDDEEKDVESDSDTSTILDDISDDSLSMEDEVGSPTIFDSAREFRGERSEVSATAGLSKHPLLSKSSPAQAIAGVPHSSLHSTHHPEHNTNRESFFLFDNKDISPPFRIIDESYNEDNPSKSSPVGSYNQTDQLIRGKADPELSYAKKRTATLDKKTPGDHHGKDAGHQPVPPLPLSTSAPHLPTPAQSGPLKSETSALHSELLQRAKLPTVEQVSLTDSLEKGKQQTQAAHVQDGAHQKQRRHVPRHSSPTSSPKSRRKADSHVVVTSSILAEGRKLLKPVENSPSGVDERRRLTKAGGARFSVEAGMLQAQKEQLRSVVTRESSLPLQGVSEAEDEGLPTVVSILKKAMTDRRFAMGDNQDSQDFTPDASWSLQEEEH